MWTDELHSHCRISKKKPPKPQKPKLPMRNEYAGNEKIINHTLNYAFFQRTCGTNYV